MSDESLARQAGSALFWRGLQLAGSKVIYLARLLILAWLLAPDDFGLLSVAMIGIEVLLKITEFGMVPALVQGARVDRRHYDAAWTVGFGRSLVVSVIVFLMAPAFAELLGEPRATDIMRVMSLRPLLTSMGSIKVAELTRKLQFRSLALLSLPEPVVSTVVSIALASSLGVWALVLGALAGVMATTVLSFVLAPYRPRLSIDGAAFRPLAGYGRWIFATGLITLTGSSVLRAVISRELGVTELGVFFLAARLAYLPYEVASEVVSSVAFPLYSQLQSDSQQAARAFQAILTGMAAILLPVYALIIVLAPSLVQEVLGPQWAGTVPVIQVLAVAGIAELFSDAVVPLLNGLAQPRKVAEIEAVQSAFIIPLAWVLAGSHGVVGAALAQLLGACAAQLVSGVYAYQVLGRSLVWLKVPLMAIALASAAGAAAALAVDTLLAGLVGLSVSIALAVLVVGLLLWALDRRLGLGLLVDVPRVFPQLRTLLRLSPSNG